MAKKMARTRQTTRK